MTARCRNPETLKRLNETERKMKEKKLQDYINMDLSNEEREKGNQVRHPQRSHVAPRQQWLHAHVLGDNVKLKGSITSGSHLGAAGQLPSCQCHLSA